MANNKMLLATAVLMLVIGYAAGSVMGSGQYGLGGKDCSSETAIRAEYTKKLTDAGLIPPVMPTKSLSGTVTAIDGKMLTVEVGDLNHNPFLAATPKVRQVTVADDAVIKSLKSADMEDFQKAQAAFNRKQATYMAALGKGGKAVEPPTAPSPFEEKVIELGDLKVGAMITVSAADDVRNAPSFTATSVQVNEDAIIIMPAAATPAAPVVPATTPPASR